MRIRQTIQVIKQWDVAKLHFNPSILSVRLRRKMRRPDKENWSSLSKSRAMQFANELAQLTFTFTFMPRAALFNSMLPLSSYNCLQHAIRLKEALEQ